MGLWDTYRKPMAKMVFIVMSFRITLKHTLVTTACLGPPRRQEGYLVDDFLCHGRTLFKPTPTWKLLPKIIEGHLHNFVSAAANKRFSKLEGQKSLYLYSRHYDRCFTDHLLEKRKTGQCHLID